MLTERNDSFGRQFQDILLAHVVRHPRLLCLAVSGKFKEEDLDLPSHRYVLKAALKVVKIQGGNTRSGIPEGPLMDQLMQMMRVGAVHDADVSALAELVAKIYSVEPLAPDYYRGMMEEFIYHQGMHRELDKATSLTLPDLHTRLNKVALASKIEENEPILPLVDFQMTTPTMCIPTGIGDIDNFMNGGLPLKEIGMICAFTGVGKTTLGTNFLWGGANNGFQTRMATLELSGQKVSQRLYSNIADYDYGKILYGDRGGEDYEIIKREIQERILRRCDGKERNLQIWDFHKERCSIQKLRDWLHRDQDRQAQKNLNPPQMLYLDWLFLLDEDPGFDPRRLSEKEVRHRIQRHMDDLSMLVAQENIALWVATQANDKAEGKSRVTIANAAEAKSSAWRIFIFAGVGMSEEDRVAKPPRALFNAAKTRDLKHFSVPIWSQLDKQRFLDYPNTAELAIEQCMGGDALTEDLVRAAQERLQAINPNIPIVTS